MPLPEEPFSTRFGVRPRSPQAKLDVVPDLIRVKLLPLIDQFRSNGLPGAYTLGPALYEAIGKMAPQPTGDMQMIRELFRDAEWWQVYDLTELLVRKCGRTEAIASGIEAIFAEANVPYAMTPDGIRWRFSEPALEPSPKRHGFWWKTSLSRDPHNNGKKRLITSQLDRQIARIA